MKNDFGCFGRVQAACDRSGGIWFSLDDIATCLWCEINYVALRLVKNYPMPCISFLTEIDGKRTPFVPEKAVKKLFLDQDIRALMVKKAVEGMQNAN